MEVRILSASVFWVAPSCSLRMAKSVRAELGWPFDLKASPKCPIRWDAEGLGSVATVAELLGGVMPLANLANRQKAASDTASSGGRVLRKMQRPNREVVGSGGDETRSGSSGPAQLGYKMFANCPALSEQLKREERPHVGHGIAVQPTPFAGDVPRICHGDGHWSGLIATFSKSNRSRCFEW